MQFILFFISSWCKIANAARNWKILSSKQQRRPLLSLVYKFFFYGSLCLGMGVQVQEMLGQLLRSLEISCINEGVGWSHPTVVPSSWDKKCLRVCVLHGRASKKVSFSDLQKQLLSVYFFTVSLHTSVRGTVHRDFWPPVFFIIQTGLGHWPMG